MRSLGRELLALAGLAVVAGGLAAALALLFVPLPLQRSADAVGYCGPGLRSDNAIQVRLDPGIVNTGAPAGQTAGTAAQQRSLERFCTGAANTRVEQALVTGLLALLIGIPVLVAGIRQASRPGSDGSGGSASSPSLSSSGTPGSTVWK
jgi:hypothetical protein